MNSIDQYRDPALDNLIQQPTRRGPSQSKRAVSDGFDRYDPGLPPPTAPEPPRGPPIAYRGAGLGGTGGLQRSFSQRARGRPFADEAFANDDLDDPYGQPNVVRQAVPPAQVPASSSAHQEAASLQPSTSIKDRHRRLIRDNIRSAADAANIPAAHDYPASAAPATASRDAANQTDQPRRDWAPDRSPLQKLEVTLNDISKEEKRARVQEAEMLLRERSRKQRAPEPSSTMPSAAPQAAARQPQISNQPPASLEDAGLVRSLTDTHRDRLQHSTIIESRRPDARRLSGEKRGFDYEPANVQPRSSVTISRSRSGAVPTTGHQRHPSSVNRTVSNPQPTATTSAGLGHMVDRNILAAQSRPFPDGVNPAQQRAAQQRLRDVDRIPTAQERNASHRAALQQLSGIGPAGPDPRDARGKFSRPQADDLAIPTDASRSTFAQQDLQRRAQAKPLPLNQANIRTSTPQDQLIGGATGLGLHQSPGGAPSIDSPVPVETRSQRIRKSSVSFKDPYERRRPVDEWKSAQTGRLINEDFILVPTEANDSSDKYKAWWEQDSRSRRRSSSSKYNTATPAKGISIDDRSAQFNPKLFLRCGPLLRYTGIRRSTGPDEREFWRGTVMIVTQDSQSQLDEPPILRLFAQPKSVLSRPPAVVQDGQLLPEHVDPVAGTTKLSRIGRALYVRPVDHLEEAKDLSRIETDEGLFEASPSPIDGPSGQSMSVNRDGQRHSGDSGERLGRYSEIKGVRLYADPDRDVTFWLFKLEVELGDSDRHISYRINSGASVGFWVPQKGHTMNVMFHSCNGFSKTVNSDDFSGPDPLWRDVLNAHQSRPFHVMIGGGDQIYMDRAVDETSTLRSWTAIRNPQHKHTMPFTTEMREELETYYLNRYADWFSQGLFSVANAQIPMVNIWDDHDIIDGFGSYPESLMKSPVLGALGNIAFKYYLLFQHQSVDAMTTVDEPSWVLGYKQGPYIKQQARSIFLQLGRPVAFLGLDCRTERTRAEVLSYDSCDIALERCRREIIEGQTRHLILLLGVPIAYPRMNWLENILTSHAMDPVKAMGRYGIVKGGFLNKFDGGVEVLDDLDDHWTARHHKEERNELVKELQDLAAERSVRITILGGDVHLAAMGQFYSNPKLKIPKDRDHRYMPNVISSAIVNTPPPEMLADALNKRNKVHHLDHYTEENMIPMFTHDTNMKKRNNKNLLPRRNWCSISEYIPGKTPPSSRTASPHPSDDLSILGDDEEKQLDPPKRRFSLSREDMNPRTLFRRLSSRNAPPTAYRQGDGSFADGSLRASSFDGTTPNPGKPEHWGSDLHVQQRSASETRGNSNNIDTDVTDSSGNRGRPPLRPGFHRRPTNLSEKAAKKGNVPAIDADGNEFDINDHVNLEGGLDIVLNCEVNQRDPAGITEPYRLLVPALWYDGSSDREKLDEPQGIQRKPTLLNKIGFGGRGQKAAQSQGAGNWGQDMSETESYSGSEVEEEQQPKKKLGLFGSLRRKKPGQELQQERDKGVDTQPTPMQEVQLGETPPQMGFKAVPGGHDMSYDSNQTRAYDQPRAVSDAPMMNVPRSMNTSETSANPSTNEPRRLQKSAERKRRQSLDAPEALPLGSHQTSWQSQQYEYPEPSLPSQPRPSSYIIGESGNKSATEPASRTSRNSAALYDTAADADYARRQQPQQQQTTYQPSNYTNLTRSRITNAPPAGVAPPSSFPQTFSPPPVLPGDDGHSSSRRNSNLSKQEQILGIATSHDAFSGNPQQTSLRGNGIIGKDYTPNQVRPSSSSAPQAPHSANPNLKFGNDGVPTSTAVSGFGGDGLGNDASGDATKPRRRFSLRDKARNVIDRIEGRNRYYADHDYSHDQGEEEGVYSDDEPYSDGEEGAYEDEQGRSNKFRFGLPLRFGSRKGA